MTVGSAHRTLREIVADEIRQMITNGDLAPGERLFEDRLAELVEAAMDGGVSGIVQRRIVSIR